MKLICKELRYGVRDHTDLSATHMLNRYALITPCFRLFSFILHCRILVFDDLYFVDLVVVDLVLG